MCSAETAGALFLKHQKNWCFRSNVQLRGLFIRRPVRNLSCYVYEGDKGGVALITLSQRAPNSFHLEMMKRTRDAPTGCMEALLAYAIKTLQARNADSFSLGEVPFRGNSENLTPQRYNCSRFLERLFSRVGTTLVRSKYSVSGLYNFKNKFHPEWQPAFWVMRRDVQLSDLLATASATRALHLALPSLFSGPHKPHNDNH
ncbi:MAG: DUF2156 domain-containing protein [Bdellovibrionales bacterium]|nr:DUF2156 domain-containing protein [Bdellovibrionales bacterium]